MARRMTLCSYGKEKNDLPLYAVMARRRMTYLFVQLWQGEQ